MEHTCAKCSKAGATKRCRKCKTAFYCSRQCQAHDWANHKQACSVPRLGAGAASNVVVTSDSGSKGPAMKPYCATCYAEYPTKSCGRCHRPYCTTECLKQDWKEKGHKHFCGRSGDLGTDFEIRDSPDKQGLGVFALRDFKMGEIIMVEKPVLLMDISAPEKKLEIFASMTHQFKNLPASAKSAISKLHPLEGNFGEKVKVNSAQVTQFHTALTITMSRLNHECIANSVNLYVKDCNVLRAVRDIASGEELTISYLGKPEGKEVRQKRLMDMYGFECKCRACTDPEVGCKLVRMPISEELDMLGMARSCDVEVNLQRALLALKEHIAISEELNTTGYSFSDFYGSLSGLFTVLTALKKPLEERLDIARKALDYADMWFGEGDPSIEESRRRLAQLRSIQDGTLCGNCG